MRPMVEALTMFSIFPQADHHEDWRDVFGSGVFDGEGLKTLKPKIQDPQTITNILPSSVI